MIWLYAILATVVLILAERILIRRVVVPSVAGILEKAPAFRVVPGRPDPRAQQVSFQTTDGISLTGSLWNGDRQDVQGLIL